MFDPNARRVPPAPRNRLPIRLLAVVAGLLLLAGLGLNWHARTPPPTPAAPTPVAATPASFVDERQCQGCHSAQVAAWQGSHHHLAMQAATPASVLGDFADAHFQGAGAGSRFFRRGDEYWINTTAADGRPADFRVAYTFGVAPLQQYLLEYPGGRLQAFDIAWDTQKHRWFELPRNETPDAGHWTQPADNANVACIDCHSSGFKRNFDPVGGRFASHWETLGVGCQACHGPASRHLQWATQPDGSAAKGFTQALGTRNAASQVDACAGCHARRTPLGDGASPGQPFMDAYQPSLLTRELYQIDGKIKGEVYEWGSFAQSSKFASGVTCSDCHDPHSGQLRVAGNGLCLQCHNGAGKAPRTGVDTSGLQTKDYDSPEHHHHRPGTAGAQCTACHMPGKYYKGNHYRHDHSFGVPNPEHSQRIGAADACLGCHRDSSSAKIAQQFERWYASNAATKPAPSSNPPPRFDDTLWRARGGQPGAARGLHLLLATGDLPALRRASLLAELPAYPSPRSQALATQALSDADPLVRVAASQAFAALAPAEEQAARLAPMLGDPIRAVRLSATWQLLQLPTGLRGAATPALPEALREYEAVQLALADRAEADLQRARLYQLSGRDGEVEPALRAALQRDADYLPALVELARWLENAQRQDEARQLLESALQRHPDAGLLHHAQGLSLLRQGQREAALKALHEAVRLSPDEAAFRYALASALHDGGQVDAACHELEQLLQRHPQNRAARLALIGYLREIGQLEKVQMQLAELEQQNPDDPALKAE